MGWDDGPAKSYCAASNLQSKCVTGYENLSLDLIESMQSDGSGSDALANIKLYYYQHLSRQM